MPGDISDTLKLATGTEMPRLGFGTYKSPPGAATRQAVLWALETGYRGIDTAALYGNEADVGGAVRSSCIGRERLFVSTKVWNADQGFEETLRAFERSLKALGMDFVDLYLVHWPIPHKMRDTWRAMEEIASSGRAGAIGVCNHLPHHLETLSGFATVPPAVNQVEFHPRLQQPGLQSYCAEHSIVLQAWAPIMRGGVFQIPEIVEIAQRHAKSPAQVSIRWILQKGHVTIPKSVHLERIRENADVFDFTLTAEEMAVLDSLDAGERIGPDPDRYGISGSK
jgi:methylglyoxal/glyoxal reductase